MADNDQWRDKLTEEEYRVTRLAGTERPFSGTLLYESRSGSYVCKCYPTYQSRLICQNFHPR